jgi:hypothetical protein
MKKSTLRIKPKTCYAMSARFLRDKYLSGRIYPHFPGRGKPIEPQKALRQAQGEWVEAPNLLT